MSTESLPSSTQVWVVQNHVTGEVDLSDSPDGTFALKRESIPTSIPEDSLLVRALYFSNDPGQRAWLQAAMEEDTKRRPEMRAMPVGSPMQAYAAIARIVAVGDEQGEGSVTEFSVGELVTTRMDWAEYAVVKKGGANKFEYVFTSYKMCIDLELTYFLQSTRSIPGISPSVFLGALGISGQTAYWCLVETLRVEPSDTLVVSAAAGATGNVAVQYAKKVLGAQRVIAIAGSEEKCRWLESIGADSAVNYKSPNFAKDLKEAAPNGVDK